MDVEALVSYIIVFARINDEQTPRSASNESNPSAVFEKMPGRGNHRLTGQTWLQSVGPVGRDLFEGANLLSRYPKEKPTHRTSQSRRHRLIESLVLTSVCCSQKIFLATGPAQGCRIGFIRAAHPLIEKTKGRRQLRLLRELSIP